MKLIIDIPDYNLNDIQNGSIACGQILKAVKNGIPVSSEGDLISRSELKKALQEYKQTQYNDDRPDLEYEYVYVDDLNYVINSTPTVEYPFYQEAYQTGYEEGQNGRPKGKWIEKEETPVSVSYYCSNCECVGLGVEHFCAWCGANMRGKEE